MDFRKENLEERRKRSSKIPGTADWVKVNLKKRKAIDCYKDKIKKIAKTLRGE